MEEFYLFSKLALRKHFCNNARLGVKWSVMKELETSILKARQMGIYVTTPHGMIMLWFKLLEPPQAAS